MISVASALQLHDAGLRWTPAPGDRFVIRQPDMQQDVFVLSDMTVESHDLPTGRIIGFNGTTEWALDSVEQDKTVWLPNEQQLRELLGDAFRRLERTTGGDFRVVATVDGREVPFVDPDASEAYARALLHVLREQAVGARAGARG